MRGGKGRETLSKQLWKSHARCFKAVWAWAWVNFGLLGRSMPKREAESPPSSPTLQTLDQSNLQYV